MRVVGENPELPIVKVEGSEDVEISIKPAEALEVKVDPRLLTSEFSDLEFWKELDLLSRHVWQGEYLHLVGTITELGGIQTSVSKGLPFQERGGKET